MFISEKYRFFKITYSYFTVSAHDQEHMGPEVDWIRSSMFFKRAFNFFSESRK